MIIKLSLIISLASVVATTTLTAPETPRTLKYKLLRVVQSGKCLDVAFGSTANGTRVVQWDCDRRKAHQRFWFRRDGNRSDGAQFVNIIPLHAEGCLDVQGASTRNGAPIILYHCTGGDNQKFIRWHDDQILAAHSGKCLDIEGAVMGNGGKLIQWECHIGANQKFIVE